MTELRSEGRVVARASCGDLMWLALGQGLAQEECRMDVDEGASGVL